MRHSRNPFRLRTAEQIDSDATFVRLFDPGVLDLLPPDHLWERLHILRSAPGGGKTSLMRLFTPNSLLTLHASRTNEEYKDLFERMRLMEAISDEGPRLLGVSLSCSRNYATLDDIEFDQGRRERLFFGLLNARIILATLRSALALKRLSYPADLERLRIVPSHESEPVGGLDLPCSGKDLFLWAQLLEETIDSAVDGFGPPSSSFSGHDTLVSLLLMRPRSILLDDQPVADHFVVMLDDVHRLTREQRRRLLDALIGLRNPGGVWIAERFEALSTDELLASGAMEGRDYECIITLERLWASRRKRFDRFVLDVADRRAQATTRVDISSFGSILEPTLNGTEWQERLTNARHVVIDRVRTLAGTQDMFQDWVTSRETISGTPFEQAIAWRALEILIERERRKAQQMFDFVLSSDELEEKDDSEVKGAAELFLAYEFSLPYYFGATKLSNIATWNIEQFLWLAGDEFEEAISAALIKQSPILAPQRQEAILKKAVQRRWSDIPRRVQNGNDLKRFLEAVGRFAHWATYQPNAPYAPGVTGIAITMADLSKLQDDKHTRANPQYRRLAETLASGLAHNFFEAVPNYKCKGELWMVLYLNRLLCVQFDLPLRFGGWRPKSLKELCTWVESGFRPPKEEPFL